MKKIEFDLPKKKPTIRSERALILSEFVERINIERKGTKWKPVTGKMIALKTSHLSQQDLYYLLSICKQAKSFGACFFGSLKVK